MEKKFSKEEIRTKLAEMVSEKFGVNLEDIHSDSSFTADLGADSLDLVEMVMSLEKAFGVSIPDADAQSFKTVSDVTGYLEVRLDAQQ